VLAIVIGLLLVWKLPRSYQSSTTVAVSSARVAPNVVGASESDKSDRLRASSQQLLSRAVLERVIREERLDRNGAMDGAVSSLRHNIGVSESNSITPGSTSQLSAEQKADLNSYQLTYTDGTPERAQRVLNRVAQAFVEENSKSREVRAQDTSQFVTAQLQASEQRLNALEARLRDAKEAYMGRLPEQTNANLQMVSALQRQLESAATATRGEQDRLTMIERQIEAIQQGADIGPISGDGAQTLSAHARVLSLRNELAGAQLSYTDKHPEVIRLRDELATAEKVAAAERTRPVSDRMAALQASPEFRQLTKDREAGKMRVADLQRQQAAASAQIRQYQMRVEGAPRVEQELVSLQREYDLERASYGKLTEKSQVAMLEEDLQRKQGGEQFAVLVPASYPSEPFEPKPMRVMLMALAAGLVIGGAGLLGREYLDRSVHDARGLRDQFELPVLAEIPRIEPVMG
jgi:polysaccharide chain length determinant protein (PEP-CTERM system associated)